MTEFRHKNKYRPYYKKKRFNKSSVTDGQILAGALGILLITALLWITKADIQKLTLSIIFFLIVVGLIVGTFVYLKIWRERRRNKALTISQIDTLRGLEFERYLEDLLKSRGFNKVYVTKTQGDFGADLIAESPDKKYAVQAKQYNTFKLVGVDAIYQVLGGMNYYDCNATMVITTGFFSEAAKELSRKTNTELIDRPILLDWIAEYTQ